MLSHRAWMCVLTAFLASSGIPAATQGAPQATGQAQSAPGNVPTLHVTSSLVFLDVTVLDKGGRPVTKGLTRDDFTITEDKKPQRIFSFEAPEVHIAKARPDYLQKDNNAPVTILVLDLLNSDFEDFAYIRYEVQRFLNAQPAELNSAAELMVVGNRSLELLQGYTRSRQDLLDALKHLPAALPYKKMSLSFFDERFEQSIDALQQIALQNRGIPGRKNVIWVGHGGPGLNTDFLVGKIVDDLQRYVHATTNMMVESRISLFVIYPGLKVGGANFSLSAMDAAADPGDTDPFAGDINFGVFVNETGGELFFNRNDIDHEMQQSLQMGSNYYTLTYQPQNEDANGKFRRIRVAMRDPKLRAVTKTGYFAPEKIAPDDPHQTMLVNLAEAARSTIPFQALSLRVLQITRHADNRSAEFTMQLLGKNLDWQPTENGKRTASVLVAGFNLSSQNVVLASRIERLTLTGEITDPERLERSLSQFPIILHLNRKTSSVRLVVETEDGTRLGSTEVARKTIDTAPDTPTPEPTLLPSPRPSVSAAN